MYSELQDSMRTDGDRLGMSDSDLASGPTFCYNYVDDANWKSGKRPLRTWSRWATVILSLFSVIMMAGLLKFKTGVILEMLGIDVSI